MFHWSPQYKLYISVSVVWENKFAVKYNDSINYIMKDRLYFFENNSTGFVHKLIFTFLFSKKRFNGK